MLLCLVTKNKAMHTTTLHTAMTINMMCMSKNVPIEIKFVQDRSGLSKFMKHYERIVFIDYGVALSSDVVERLVFGEFPDGYKVLTVPCITGDVDWNTFKKKTLDNPEEEPAHQRALKFDIEFAQKKSSAGISEFVSSSTDCRVFALDCKPILKKLRDGDAQFKSFDQLKKLGIKIGVLRSAPVTCHYVYECIGNILESSGVRTTPPDGTPTE